MTPIEFVASDDPLLALVNDRTEGVTFDGLGATDNVQGLHSRSVDVEFIHIEVEKRLRVDMDGVFNDNRDIIASLIAQALVPEPSSGLYLVVSAVAISILRRRFARRRSTS